jgi:hypothetical protein
MMICYALEGRSHWFVLAFAGAWPFGLVEGIWTLVALRRWLQGRG